MSLPEVTETIQDGALGTQEPSSDKDIAIVGVCTAGTANTVYAFNDPQTLKSTLVGGPAVDAAALQLSQPGHGTVFVTPITASVAGTAGSVTATRVASSTGTIPVTGAPNDSFNVIVTIVTGEATVAGGGGVFTYSLDGGNTTSQQTAIPTGGAFVIPGTGLTITFTTGGGTAFTAGDVFTFLCVAPGYSSSDVTAAFTALFADNRTWRFVLLVGQAAAASGTATIASTVASQMTAAEAAFRYAYAIIQCADDTDGNIVSALANFSSPRVMIVGGFDDQQSLLTGRTMKRGGSIVTASRLMVKELAEDPGRVASGPLNGISKLYRDEYATPALDAARLTTLRTYVGKTGFYVTQGRTMAAAGSDYTFVVNRQVMDKICTAVRAILLDELNNDLVANPNTVTAPLVSGAIDELEARRIEKKALAYVRTQIGKNASGITIVIDRTVNLLTTATLKVQVRATPKGYARAIQVDIGFASPLLTLASAA